MQWERDKQYIIIDADKREDFRDLKRNCEQGFVRVDRAKGTLYNDCDNRPTGRSVKNQ